MCWRVSSRIDRCAFVRCIDCIVPAEPEDPLLLRIEADRIFVVGSSFAGESAIRVSLQIERCMHMRA